MSNKRSSGSSGRPVKQPLPAWSYGVAVIFLICIAVAVLLIIRPAGMDKTAIQLVHLLIALIPSLALFGFMHSHGWRKTELSQKIGKSSIRRVATEWGGPVALFIVLFFGMPFQDGGDPEPFSFAIFLRDVSGEKVLKDKGYVHILLDGKVTKAKIDEDGRANFEGIPPKFKNQKVRVELDAPGFLFEKGNNVFCVLKGKNVFLTVKRKLGLEIFSGRVIDVDGNAVPGARVSIRDSEVTSDANGWFTIHIPPEKQAETQTLVTQKQGFKTDSCIIYPGKDQTGFIVRLTKE